MAAAMALLWQRWRRRWRQQLGGGVSTAVEAAAAQWQHGNPGGSVSDRGGVAAAVDDIDDGGVSYGNDHDGNDVDDKE